METQVTQSPTVLEYEGIPVSFLLDSEQTWVNATQMARSCGRRPNDYLASSRAQEMISALNSITGNSGNWFFAESGPLGGTWLHRELAMDFARWLNPKFAIWCDRVIRELLEARKNELNKKSKTEAITRSQLAQWVIESEAENAELKAEIAANAPRVELAKRIESSPSYCSVDECAKELQAPPKMFREWVQSKYLFRRHGEWWAREEYGPNGQGLFSMRTGSWTARNGAEIISHSVKVTGKGRTVLAHGLAKHLQGIENTLSHIDRIGAHA